MTVDEFFALYIILTLVCIIATMIEPMLAFAFILPALMMTGGFLYGLFLGFVHIYHRIAGKPTV